jgi:hypothetical protein
MHHIEIHNPNKDGLVFLFNSQIEYNSWFRGALHESSITKAKISAQDGEIFAVWDFGKRCSSCTEYAVRSYPNIQIHTTQIQVTSTANYISFPMESTYQYKIWVIFSSHYKKIPFNKVP